MMQERLKPNADGSPTVVAVLANRERAPLYQTAISEDVMISGDSLTYMALMVGILRAGFVPFLISPRNALPGVMNMLERSKTVAIMSAAYNSHNPAASTDAFAQIIFGPSRENPH
jgi:acyl-CoA synthetase (AMP-forming)/AMP-acid ligase II